MALPGVGQSRDGLRRNRVRTWLGPSSDSTPASNAIAGVAVLGILASIAFGLPALDRSLPRDADLPAGTSYLVGAGLVLVPPAGARLDLTRSRPDTDAGSVVFRFSTAAGEVRLSVLVSRFDGTAPQAAGRLSNRLRARRDVTVGPALPVAGVAMSGVEGGYGDGGRYLVLVGRGISVQATLDGAPPAVEAGYPPARQSLLDAVPA